MEQDFASKTLDKEVTRIDKWIKYVATRSWIKSGLFTVAVLETTILPILPELVVAAILSYRKDVSWKLLSVISALGSTLGAGILYFSGKFLYRNYEDFFNGLLGTTLGNYTESLFAHNTFISLFLAAFTPLPDRVFALLSGMFSLPVFVVLVAFFCGRLIRVGIVAYFSYEYGDEAREYILKHTRTATIVILLLVALYIFYKLLV